MSIDRRESRGRIRPEGNPLPWTGRRGLESAAGLRSAAFTLIEMLVAIALLLVLMALAGQAFKVALDGTGRLTQLSQVDRSARTLRDHLARELASINPSQSILAIQSNPSPAYWTEIQKRADDDGNMLNGLGSQRFSLDPLRENPTLSYDPVDEDDDRSFDGELDLEENFYPQLPRADILLLVTNLPDERSKVDADVRSDGPVMLVYGHAELGLLNAGSRVVIDDICRPGDDFSDCDNDSTDDWAELRPIPTLQDGGGMDPRQGVQEVAQFWHLARRAILLKRNFDPREAPAAPSGFDRYAHVLSPTDPLGNQPACVGFLEQPIPAVCNGRIDTTWERHYLNWILGGEMDVVAPAGGSISAQFLAAGGGNLQDFVFAYEVPQRYFGGLGSLDVLLEDRVDNSTGFPPSDGQRDPNTPFQPGAVSTRRLGGAVGFWRGAVPAFWLARSHLDPEPPATLRHRLGHYFLPNCASFKVEWTPNDIRLEQAGLPEVVWIDPFKEPGTNNRLGAPLPGPATHPDNSITPMNVQKPMHLDEFEILGQKLAPASDVELANNAILGFASPFGIAGHPLLQVHQSLKARFALSHNAAAGAGGVVPAQANVFDADVGALPAAAGVQPSYNTHSWYARDLTINNAGWPRTLTAPDPLWPKALRITVDLFDDSGKLEKPVRHVFILPIGSKDDRKQTLG